MQTWIGLLSDADISMLYEIGKLLHGKACYDKHELCQRYKIRALNI